MRTRISPSDPTAVIDSDAVLGDDGAFSLLVDGLRLRLPLRLLLLLLVGIATVAALPKYNAR